MEYVLAIGSNEQCTENMALARKRLREFFPHVRFSKPEKTKPIGLRRTAFFVNQVACFTSHLFVEDIIMLIKAIEEEAGRTPQEKELEIIRLDIDLLQCNELIYKPFDMEQEYIFRGLKQLKKP